MATLSYYLDMAKSAAGVDSDRALARQMDISTGHAAAWRTGRAFPTDKNMVKLAELAGLSPLEALVDLNIMRNEGAAKALYSELRDKVSSRAA